MSIDWFTVTVQLLNFLILVYLIKRLLYKPVLQVIAQRKENYQQQQQAISAQQKKADQTFAKYQQLQTHLAEKREQLLLEAETAAKTHHDGLLREAKQDIAKQKKQWQQQFDQQVKTTLVQFDYRLLTELCRLSKHLVTDLADSHLQKQVVYKFIYMLQTLDETACKKLRAAWQRSHHAQIITVIKLDKDEKSDIVQALEALLDSPEDQRLTIDWEQQADLILGVNLKVGEWQLKWSIHRYLDRLEQSLYENLARVIQHDS